MQLEQLHLFLQSQVFRLFLIRKENEASKVSPLQARPDSVLMGIEHSNSTQATSNSQTVAEVRGRKFFVSLQICVDFLFLKCKCEQLLQLIVASI